MSEEYTSELEKHYPRIMNELLSRWGSPRFEPYANQLIIDERGSRKGFSPEVIAELLFLYALDMFARDFDTQQAFVPYANPTYRK
jgi:hypothetical protein